ncbi:MAG: YbjN domain-containing protein [Myxococcales bacterium]|nr:YbjN domain-containing protein [Myxococcales bacterium]
MSEETITVEFERAVGLIEKTIRQLGVDPEAVKLDPPGGIGRGWSLMRGSAAVAVFLRNPREGEDAPQLRVVAPIVKIDAAQEAALFRRLLELNAQGMGPLAFGLLHDRVVVLAERRSTDLEPAEVEHLIQRVGAVADHYDDQLIARFGGQRVSDLS